MNDFSWCLNASSLTAAKSRNGSCGKRLEFCRNVHFVSKMNWLDLVVKGQRLCDSSSSLVFVWILLFLDSTLAWILEYIFNDIYAFTNVCMSENWERQTVYFKNWNTYTWCKVKSKYLKTMEYLLWLIKKSFRIYERVTSASKHQCCEGEVISVFWLLAHTQGGHSLWPAVYLHDSHAIVGTVATAKATLHVMSHEGWGWNEWWRMCMWRR